VKDLNCIAPYTWIFRFDDGRYGKIWYVKRKTTSTYGDHWVGAKSDTEYGAHEQTTYQEIIDFHETFKISVFDPPEFFELPKGDEFYGTKASIKLTDEAAERGRSSGSRTWEAVRPDGLTVKVQCFSGDSEWYGRVVGNSHDGDMLLGRHYLRGFREFHGLKYHQGENNDQRS